MLTRFLAKNIMTAMAMTIVKIPNDVLSPCSDLLSYYKLSKDFGRGKKRLR
jgi:hypothetical protein